MTLIALTLLHLAATRSRAWQAMELLSRFDLDRVGYEPDGARSLRAAAAAARGVEDVYRWVDGFTTPVPDEPLTWLQNPHLFKTRVLLARGAKTDVQSALEILDALYELPSVLTRAQIEVAPVRALALDALGRAANAQAALRHAVELSRGGGFIRPFVDLGPRMQDLLGFLAAKGFARESIRRILAAFPTSPAGLSPSLDRSEIGNRPSPIVEPLTMREYDVLILLRGRLSNKEIAHELHLSTATVKRHLVNLYGKLGVGSGWRP
jgi:LuxR family maltose regulon positive regulatory protein